MPVTLEKLVTPEAASPETMATPETTSPATRATPGGATPETGGETGSPETGATPETHCQEQGPHQEEIEIPRQKLKQLEAATLGTGAMADAML